MTDLDTRPRTHLPLENADRPSSAREPVELGLSRDSILRVAGAAVAALGIGALLSPVLGIVPPGWMPITAFGFFIVIYTALVSLRENAQAVKDRYWTVVLWSAAVTALGVLALVIGFILLSSGDVWAQMFDLKSGQSLWQRLHFFTQDMSVVGPLAGLDQGGILHAIVGTLIQIGIAIVITMPLGLATALFLAEVGGRFARVVSTVTDAMTGLPSVVAGLFIYATVIVLFTHQFNGFAASLAVTVLMLPIMIRAASVVLRLVPGNLREAGLALGASRWAVVRSVVLPTSRSGLVTAMILAVAHGIGETAPVLLTAGVTQNLNVNPFDGSMISLPLAALEFIKSSQNPMKARGYATAAVLLILVIIIFVIARRIGGQAPGKLTPRQSAALRLRSGRTSQRMRVSAAAALAQLAELEASRARAGGADGTPPIAGEAFPVEAPARDDLFRDDPLIDDPLIDDPLRDDPLPDDPLIDDPLRDDPLLDDLFRDDPFLDDPPRDDPRLDDPPDHPHDGEPR